MNTLKIGDLVPQFSLPDQDGEQVSSSDFIGQRLLIYFYPKSMTPGCTLQACGLRDNMDKFQKAKVEILGISTDKPEKLYRFVEQELLNFNLLSDTNHEVCKKFGVWGEKSLMGKTYMGVYRMSFLIDENGRVEQVFNNFQPSNHHNIILDYLCITDKI
ncbi:thioredoxin-dependent thiol peroxidase [Candidatus Ishikawella capsulata]|nr:thioredoxin-dependent thiol peroxidase [Candidatus Ishikawaella capsulata]